MKFFSKLKYFLIFILCTLILSTTQASCLIDTLSAIVQSVQMRRLAYGYKPTLAKSKNLLVVGPTQFKNLGKGILARMARFDQYMVNSGFRLPEHTKIFIQRMKFTINNNGAFYFHTPILNTWDRKISNIIELRSHSNEFKHIKSKNTLHHERMHSLLRSTYNEKAFINNSDVLQEAFSDFASIHYANNPKFSVNYYDKGVALRDIETKVADRYMGQSTINTIYDFNNSYHENSVLFSNVLWQMNQKIGKEEMIKLLKPIIDDLNSYAPSFKKFLELNKLHFDSKNSFYYFLNSIELTLEKDQKLKIKLQPLLEKIKYETKCDLSSYKNIKESLVASSENFKYTGEKRTLEALKMSLVGLAPEIAVGYVAYEGADALIDFIEKRVPDDLILDLGQGKN